VTQHETRASAFESCPYRRRGRGTYSRRSTPRALAIRLEPSTPGHRRIARGFTFSSSRPATVSSPAGERILRTARVVLPEIERAELDLNRDSKEMLGTIRIGVECDSCYSWLAGSLRRFGRRYPNIVLQLSTTSAQRPIQALLKNDIDLAVVAQPLRELRIRLCELFEEEFVAVVAPAHSLAEKEYLLPKDFASETLFCPGTFSEGLLYQKVLRPAGIRPKEVNEITLMEPTLQLVKYGFGITVLARWAIHSRPANDEFRTVPITSRGLRRTWHAATRSSRNLPEYLTTLLEALQSESGR